MTTTNEHHRRKFAVDEQQQRNQASMDLLEKMSQWIDEQMEIDEELERQEQSWRDRCIKPAATEEEAEE